MARFDVYGSSGDDRLLMDVQAGLHEQLHTRLVVPLVQGELASRESVRRLKPMLVVNGAQYMMSTSEMATVWVSDLGPLVENIESQRQVVVDAVDFLLQGF